MRSAISPARLYICPAGTTPRTELVGYTDTPLPSTAPGFKTLLQPTSTWSPSMAPNFLSPVAMLPPSNLTTTRLLSLLTLDVMEPAPICDLYPSTLSPT